jgi:hypothetical protein
VDDEVLCPQGGAISILAVYYILSSDFTEPRISVLVNKPLKHAFVEISVMQSFEDLLRLSKFKLLGALNMLYQGVSVEVILLGITEVLNKMEVRVHCNKSVDHHKAY